MVRKQVAGGPRKGPVLCVLMPLGRCPVTYDVLVCVSVGAGTTRPGVCLKTSLRLPCNGLIGGEPERCGGSSQAAPEVQERRGGGFAWAVAVEMERDRWIQAYSFSVAAVTKQH